MPHALRRANVLPGRLPAWISTGTVLCLALLLALGIAVQLGAVPIARSDWWAPFGGSESMSGGAHVLWQLRLPRALLAAAVGAALGLAGALAQALFRNPLADPGLLGVTSGAACAAALVLTVFAGAQWPIPAVWRIWVLPASAFAGALAACLVLDRRASAHRTGIQRLNDGTDRPVHLHRHGRAAAQPELLDAGIAGRRELGRGGRDRVGAGPGALQTRRLAQALNALALGDAAAAHVGVDVPRLRSTIVVTVALLSALAVAWCGLIGFIGLMAPHLVRGLTGPDQHRVLPLSMLAGALLLVLADTVARTIAIPAEIPVGIFTALIGGPSFLVLLCAVARQQGGHA